MPPKRYLTEAEIAKILRLGKEEKLPISIIAIRMQLNQSTVNKILRGVYPDPKRKENGN